MRNQTPVIHTYIERDRQHKWHGVVELRYRGRVIYAVSFTKGCVFPHVAANMATQEMIHIEKAAQRA